jgi:hypothetical protein
LAYTLAKDSKLAQEIYALSDAKQAARFGKMEDKFIADKKAATVSAKTTSAPAPVKQPRGSGGQFTPAEDTEDFASFEAAYGLKPK